MSDILFLTYTISYFVVAILHLIGLSLLCKSKSNIPNQRTLTCNLAVVELMSSLIIGTIYSLAHYSFALNLSIIYYLHAISTVFVTEIQLTVLHIIIDRFFEIYTNINYPLFMTKKRLLFIVTLHWFFSAVCAIITFVLVAMGKSKASLQFVSILFLIFDIIITVSGITTYLYFYKTVFHIRELEARCAGQTQVSGISLLREKFKIPCYIVMTYICFNLPRTILLTVSHYVEDQKKSSMLTVLSHALIIIGLTSDVFIYVFADKNVRMLICSIFRKMCRPVSNRVDDTSL